MIYRLSALILCVAVISVFARGVSKPGSSKSAIAETSTAVSSEAAPYNYRWNLEDRNLPLLDLLEAHLKRGLDQSLSYPLGQARLLVTQTLNVDVEHHRYFLAAAAQNGPGVHFIEFVSTGNPKAFVSTDASRMRLDDNDTQKTISNHVGQKLIYVRYPDGEFHCAAIKQSARNSLNFLYTSNGLRLHGIVDATGRTITFSYAAEGMVSLTQTWISNSTGLSRTWAISDRAAITPIETNIDPPSKLTNLKIIPANALIQRYTAEMAASDKVLAAIFGGPGAVAAAHGFEPPGLAAAYPLYRGDIMGDDGVERRGHLSYAMHLYGNASGTGDSPLYVPQGFTSHSSEPSPTDAVVTFYYPRLGTMSDVTLAVFHVADFQIKPEGDRILIGNIGGSGGNLPLYKHSHLEFYRGNTGLPPLNLRAQLRIDPAIIFEAPMGSGVRASLE